MSTAARNPQSSAHGLLQPQLTLRRLRVKHNASDAPIAIERVVIVVGPSAVRAAFGCTFEGQQWALHGTISLRQYLLFLSSFCQKAISAAGAFDVGVYRLDVQIEIRN